MKENTMKNTMKHILAIIPIIGASVLLCGQPYSSNNLLMTNEPTVNDLVWRGTNAFRVAEITPMVYFYTNHQVFVADSRYGPTNIVISNNYSGTIQIGSNYWKPWDATSFRATWAWKLVGTVPPPWTTYSDGTNLVVSNNYTGTVKTNSP